MGMMQGLTEFLPVSSSGHLIVMHRILGLAPSAGAGMEVALHVGTLIAIFVGYRKELGEWMTGLWRHRRQDYQLLGKLALASVPAAAVGYWAGAWITGWFVPAAAAAGWLLTTMVLWMTPPAAQGSGTLEEMTGCQALVVGIFQAFALWPGLSRSGSTIFAARVLGLKPEDAARLSFFMAIPVVAGATALTLSQGHLFMPGEQGRMILGMGVAAISGLFALKWVKHALGATRLWRQFGVYTLILALLTLWLGGL